MEDIGFAINENKGFQITFDNGVTVSVQFGGGNYCQNRSGIYWKPAADGARCADAEVAIWNKDGWMTREYDPDLYDDVIGNLNPSQVLMVLIWAKAYKGAN